MGCMCVVRISPWRRGLVPVYCALIVIVFIVIVIVALIVVVIVAPIVVVIFVKGLHRLGNLMEGVGGGKPPPKESNF